MNLLSEMPLRSQMPQRGSEVPRFFILDLIFTKNNFIYPTLYISYFVLLSVNSTSLYLYFCTGVKGFVYTHINDNPYRQAYKTFL